MEVFRERTKYFLPEIKVYLLVASFDVMFHCCVVSFHILEIAIILVENVEEEYVQ